MDVSMDASSLRATREQLVERHMDSEARKAFDETLETFHHARYEVIPTGEEYDGNEAVGGFYAESETAFPDFRFENTVFHHTDDAVITETDFVGTQLGPWRGLPATGKEVRYRMCNLFLFEGEDLVCERMYFDLITALRQLGIARDPTSLWGRIMIFVNHPIAVTRAFVSSAFRK
jgi:steroid delta-isomerase-like uncharacterized protein